MDIAKELEKSYLQDYSDDVLEICCEVVYNRSDSYTSYVRTHYRTYGNYKERSTNMEDRFLLCPWKS